MGVGYVRTAANDGFVGVVNKVNKDYKDIKTAVVIDIKNTTPSDFSNPENYWDAAENFTGFLLTRKIITTSSPTKTILKVESTATTRGAKQLAINKKNSFLSESTVKQRLTNQLGKDEAILDKPRIYIGDGSSGKYAQPDFGIYNTKTGQFIMLVDAKDGNAVLTRAQEQINQYGGFFKGSSRAPEVVPQKIAKGTEAIKIERTNVAQGSN